MLYVMGQIIFPRQRSRKLTIYCRFCVLRRLLKERALPISGRSTTALLACSGRILIDHPEVHTICLDSYGMHPLSGRSRKLPLIDSQALYIIVFQVYGPNPPLQHPYSISLLTYFVTTLNELMIPPHTIQFYLPDRPVGTFHDE